MVEVFDLRPALGDDAKNPLDKGCADFSVIYTSMADDEAIAKSKREAAMLLSVAESQLSDRMLKECLEAAEQALKLFRQIEDDACEADAGALIVSVQQLQADVEGRPATAALGTALEQLSGFRRRGKKRGEARAMLAAGEVYANMERPSKDLPRALSLATDALKLFVDLSDRRMQAAAHLAILGIRFQKKMPKEAEQSANEALSIFRLLSDRKGEARALHGCAIASAMLQDFSSAVKNARMAASIFKDLGDSGAQARELQSIAMWSRADDQLAAAMAAAQESLCIWRKLKAAPKFESAALLLVCEAFAAAGKERQAVKVAKAGLARFEEAGDQRGVAAGLEVLLEAYVLAAMPDKALLTAEAGLRIARDLRDRHLELALLRRVWTFQLYSSPFEAAQTLRKAIRLAQEDEDPVTEADALATFAFAQVRRLDIQNDVSAIQEALSLASDARRIYERLNCSFGEVQCLLAQASLRILNQEGEAALPVAREAQAIANMAGESLGEACACRLLCEWHMEVEEYDAAMEEAIRWVDIVRAAGEKRTSAQAMLKVASIHLARGNDSLALQVAQEAYDIVKEVSHAATESNILCFLADVYVSRSFHEGLEGPSKEDRDKASKAIKEALLLAGVSKNEDLRGTALLLRAQLKAGDANLDEALRSGMEAEKLFAKTQHLLNQAQAQAFCAGISHAKGDKKEALRLAQSALELTRQPGWEDANVESVVLRLLEDIDPQQPLYDQGRIEAADIVADTPMAQSVVEPVAQTGLDPAMVKSKLVDLVMNNIASGEDIEADEPLGEAGLDSLASVQLVTDIGREFKVTVSPAAVFDYPSINTLVAHIVEESAG